ncbi:MAG: Hsp20/alpha crystallin family protein [Litoreibacter sp.]|nr:Hsp20/alpha crystallin family protein [Litoreibacter sp.]
MVEKSHSSGLWPSIYEPFKSLGSRISDWIAPASEASTSGEAYTISLELPGVAEADIDVSAHDGVVTVKGEKRVSREDSGETWFFSERQYGAFTRSFRLPPDADENKISGELKNGVLTLTVPKATKAEAPSKKVKIRTG